MDQGNNKTLTAVLTAFVGAAGIFFSSKLGITLTPDQQLAIVGLLGALILKLGFAYHQDTKVELAQVQAKSDVKTVGAAVAVLNTVEQKAGG